MHIILSRLRKKPTPTGPSFARKSYIDGQQLAFYRRLRHALPNCTMFPNVALSDLIEPLAGDVRLLRQQVGRLDGVRISYAIFDEMLELLCVIELSPAGVQCQRRAQALAILDEVGISCFTWEHDNLPSLDQILRTMSAYTDVAPSRFEPAANSALLPTVPTWETVVAPTRPAAFSLSVDDVYRLTPHGNVRAMYPHIWERICLFCHEPRQLEQYLGSLSLQNRGEARTGFPQAAIIELSDLQGANARYIPAQPRLRTGWNDSFINR